MAKRSKNLRLRIEQNGRVVERHLRPKDKLTVGPSPSNDIMVFGDALPKRHVLLKGGKDRYELHLFRGVEGEVRLNDSSLSIQDLIEQEVLPRKGRGYLLPITRGKYGYVRIGDALLQFRYDGKPEAVDLAGTEAFSWTRTTLRSLTRDLGFKLILVALLLLNSAILFSFSKKDIRRRPRPAAEIIPKRFAKFVIKPKESPAPRGGAESGGPNEAKKEATTRPKSARKSTREVNPESQGILGLLAGVGPSNQSSSVVDFLVDKGLAQQLDEVLSETNLEVGRGSNKRGEQLDELLALSQTGGIDDILSDIEEVETVELEKKGSVQLQRVGRMEATREAVGKRTEESIRSIIVSYYGRIEYIYNKYLKKDPELGGKMVVEITIAPEGHVASYRIISSSIKNASFEREILDVIRRLKWDPIDEGYVTVQYPLVFQKIG
jgi:TonB family protein